MSGLCQKRTFIGPEPSTPTILNRLVPVGVTAPGEAALQRKVTRLKEKSGSSSSLPPVWQLYRANFPPTQTPLPPAFFVGDRSSKRRDRMIAAEVIRKFATDVDEPVLAEPRKGFIVRFMEALRETRRRHARREIAKHAHLLPNDSWQQLDL
jgi:hypothetical protein